MSPRPYNFFLTTFLQCLLEPAGTIEEASLCCMNQRSPKVEACSAPSNNLAAEMGTTTAPFRKTDKSLKVTWKWSWIQRSFVAQDEKMAVWWPVFRPPPTQNPHKAWYSSPYLQSQHLCGEMGGRNGKIPETLGTGSLACTAANYTQYHTRWTMRTDTQGCSLTVIHVPWHMYTDAHTHTPFLMK